MHGQKLSQEREVGVKAPCRKFAVSLGSVREKKAASLLLRILTINLSTYDS